MLGTNCNFTNLITICVEITVSVMWLNTRFIFEIDQTCQNSNIRMQNEFVLFLGSVKKKNQKTRIG